MGRIVPFVLVLVAIATQELAAPQNVKKQCKHRKPGKHPHLYDVNVLTLHSRGGYCELNSCKKIPVDEKYPHPPMTIKSFTTRLANGTEGPTSCMDLTFDTKKIEDIRSKLAYYWPSFNPKITDEDLWKDQFEKYGSCFLCQEVVSIEDSPHFFFQAALIRYDAYNISHYFNKTKIVQSYENPILLKKLKKAFKKHPFDAEPEFYCVGKRNNTDILQEIRFCRHSESKTFVKCPPTGEPTCRTEKVWYLGNSSITQMPSTIMVIFTMLVAYLISKGQ